MSNKPSILNSLIDADDSCLIVIDAQKVFFDKLAEEEVEPLIKRMVWIVDVAVKLEIPVVVTAEYVEKNGSIIPELLEVLPSETKIHDKMIFGLAADPEIFGAVQSTNRNTAILLGLETDVCVAQSAIGLLEHGYRVVVLEDAVGSPGKAHQYGLARMRSAGVLLSNVKSLFYEWLRTVENSRNFYHTHKDDLRDPGIPL
jgi:nicotinamidase-related amidase